MRENNAKIQKIQKSSNVAFILVKIMKIFCITMSVISIVCWCGVIGAKGYLDQVLAEAVETGEVAAEELYVNTGRFLDQALDLAHVESVSLTLGVYMIVTGIVLICFSIVSHFMGKVFKDIKESYSPFRPEIVKSLKVVFVLITMLSLRSSLLIGAVVGFSLWCVFQIFEYGCELQRQSDETL